jgi:DNA ligase-1
MYDILKIVEELQSTSGKLDKMAILKREESNEKWKKYLKYVSDDKYVYGIQSKKMNRFLGKTDGITSFQNLFEIFEFLLDGNNTGSDETIQLVASFIDSQPEDVHEFYVDSLCKKVRMGIDSTINKVYGKGFLSEFKVMLAKDFYKESHKVENKEFVLTEKLDGQRIIAIHNSSGVNFFSRTGQPILGLSEIEAEIKQLDMGVYDGEALIKNEHLYKDRDVLQETLKISRKDGEKTGLNYWIFDYLPLDEFEKGKSKLKYIERKTGLACHLSMRTLTRFNHIYLLPILYQGKDMSVIPNLLQELEDEGKEGLMLNLSDGHWINKRTDQLLKIKTMMTFDEKCVGIFEGEGKYKGMLGGINVLYKGYPLKCGSGFNDVQRKLYFDNPDLIIGQLVEIQYFRESSNDQGGLSVSFPIFKGIREDKNEPSYY